MYPIKELIGDSSPQSFDTDGFRKRMIEICRCHHTQKRALIFAIVLYDFRHAYIRKMLQDETYWSALNSISGNVVTAFAVDSPAYRDSVPISLDCSMIESEFARLLNNGKKIHPPSIVFFQVENEIIVDSALVSLDQKKVEDSFLEISKILERSVGVLKYVTEENRENVTDIFKLVANDIWDQNSRKLVTFVKYGLKSYKALKDLI